MTRLLWFIRQNCVRNDGKSRLDRVTSVSNTTIWFMVRKITELIGDVNERLVWGVVVLASDLTPDNELSG
jgi:hypothetical protein